MASCYYLQYVSVVSRSMVSCLSLLFFLPILVGSRNCGLNELHRSSNRRSCPFLEFLLFGILTVQLASPDYIESRLIDVPEIKLISEYYSVTTESTCSHGERKKFNRFGKISRREQSSRLKRLFHGFLELLLFRDRAGTLSNPTW